MEGEVVNAVPNREVLLCSHHTAPPHHTSTLAMLLDKL